MIKITKAEAMYLQQKGFKFGSTLHHTVHNHAYYMSEYYNAMKCLNNYRKSRLIRVFEKKVD